MAFEIDSLPRILKLIKMSVEEKTAFIMAIRNYKYSKKKRSADFTDTTASDASNKKILLRSIEPRGKAGFVGVDEVKSMLKVMKSQNYDNGILISKRFTTAAVQEMLEQKIQLVSDEHMPYFDTEELYLTINNCIDNQCKANCGKILQKKSDCTGRLEDSPCKVRALSDNCLFHFEHGWIDLMKNDLKQLLALNKVVQ